MLNSERQTFHIVYTAAFISFHSNNTAFDMEFTATERVQQKLIKDGYLYILQKNLANDFTSLGMRVKDTMKAYFCYRHTSFFE